ncbi:MAG: arsenate reductase ArsC [Chloroflexi bacterium]|nr:arsenate reductase ArsC [Chloroflexota bacterium]
MAKQTILFVCVHNSARSILAEQLVNHFHSARFVARSAGLDAREVNPYTLRVLREIGIDASDARSKSVEEFRGANFDWIVTVCAPTEGACPIWIGAGKRIHLPFEDPARALGMDAEILARFRATRDEMRAQLDAWLNVN